MDALIRWGGLVLIWGLFAISLFNTVLLLWLGLMVLLSSERRTLGVYVLGVGLLGGAGFFIAHIALLWFGLSPLGQNIDLWWRLGWVLVVFSPLSWYGMMMWYAGFWAGQSPRRRRHRWAFGGLTLSGLVLIALIVSRRTLPSYEDVSLLELSNVTALGPLPLLFVIFPLFILACIGLSIDVLRNPAPSERMMGDRARQRTRPWLMATSITLMLVSILVSAFILWVGQAPNLNSRLASQAGILLIAMVADLVIATLIGFAVLFLGQGIVTYEVFTGKTLPRRGFARHWRGIVLIALGYGVVVGGGISSDIHPVYTLLLTSVLMVTFYALFSWRSFAEREQFMAQLRPFVDGQGFLSGLLLEGGPTESRARRQFEALCGRVLGVYHAQLHVVGALAPFAGQPLTLPPDADPLPVAPLVTGRDSPTPAGFTLDPQQAAGHHYAVDLWSGRGLVGVLLLGHKANGSLYTREELEIARAGAERIIDMLIGEEVVQQLMAVQTARHRQGQVLDRRVRRALHDDVLPDLHAAIITLSAMRDEPAADDALATLSQVHKQVSTLIHQNSAPLAPDEQTTLIAALREMVSSEFAGEFDSVEWQVRGKPAPLEPLALDVMLYAAREALRNAAVHGRGGDAKRPLGITIHLDQTNGTLLTIRDDGVGFNATAHAPSPGVGGGLALHTTLMTVIGGRLTTEEASEGGTRVTLELA